MSKVSDAIQRLRARDNTKPGGIVLMLPDWQAAFRAGFNRWCWECGLYPKRNWLNRK